MDKLLNLKERLTIADTARHLSGILEDEVSEADVLQLALDRRLRLSVHFVNHANARYGKVVGLEDAEMGEITPEWTAKMTSIADEEKGKPVPYVSALPLGGERYLNLAKEVVISGVWDLPMVGGERLDVEQQFQNLTGGACSDTRKP